MWLLSGRMWERHEEGLLWTGSVQWVYNTNSLLLLPFFSTVCPVPCTPHQLLFLFSFFFDDLNKNENLSTWRVCVLMGRFEYGGTDEWMDRWMVIFPTLQPMTLLRAFWFSGSAEECWGLLGTRFLIWQADFLANYASSSSSFPTFFALPSLVPAKFKKIFPI